MVLTLLTLIAAVLDTVLVTVVWLRFREMAAARHFVAIIAIRITFAFTHHVYLPAATSPGGIAAVACLRWVLLPLASLCQLLFFLSIYEERWLTPGRARAIAAAFLALGAVLMADVALRAAPLLGAPGPLAGLDPFGVNPHPALLVVFSLTWLPGIAVIARTMVRLPSERMPLLFVLAASFAGVALGALASKLGALGNAAALFDVIVTGSLAYLLLKRRVFETTRTAIDAALTAMAEGIAVLGEDGRVLYTNPSMEAQTHLRAGMTAEGLAVRDPPLAEVLRTLDAERALFHVQLEDREMLLASSPILDADARLHGHLLLAQDVTDEEQARRARDRAEAASAAKSAFLSHMSHELRTPLNAILGFSQLLARDRTLGREARRHLAIVERSGRHLLELINGVLDLSKIEAGKLALVEARFSPARVLADVESMFRDLARDKGLSLTFHGGASLPAAVLGDEGKLRQILINLVGNALKFTERGAVTVRASTVRASMPDIDPTARPSEPCRLRFEVEDTGPGLDEAARKRLFQAFSTPRGPGGPAGTGLGLLISRELVRALGGEIHVSSTPGAGSTFTFDVRFAVATGEAAAEEPDRRSVVSLVPGQPTFRILVADDREENRELLVELLSTVGFDVRSAANGREALEQWETWEPQLIWMDMRMPVVDGYEATRRIKQTPRGKSTVIIALTASAFEQDRAQVLAAGCDDFVRKPLRDAEVFERIAHHLGVRYVYGEPPGDRPAEPPPPPDNSLSTAALLALPEPVRERLRRAAESLSPRETRAVIADLEADHADLAARLEELVRAYRFDRILASFDNGGTQ